MIIDRRARSRRILSRRVRLQLDALYIRVHTARGGRNAALRRLTASRYAATSVTQYEFWLEFSWLDQEYRAAVRQLAEFCAAHHPGAGQDGTEVRTV